MEKRFVIVQTDDYDLYLETPSEKDAEFLLRLLDDLMRDHCHGKSHGTFRGMHLWSDPDGADKMTSDISRELFGVEVNYIGGLVNEK
jgi:hypothetical protein